VSEGYEEGDFDRGRHAVIADHCDLASVARIEDVYAGALVESLDVAD
jgi:hypothetical protein